MTVVETIDPHESGNIHVRFGIIESSRKVHRAALEPADDVDALIAAVNANITTRPDLLAGPVETDRIPELRAAVSMPLLHFLRSSVVMPSDTGAVGDGVADDRAAIIQAIGAVQQEPRTRLVFERSYGVGSAVRYAASGHDVEFWGDGRLIPVGTSNILTTPMLSIGSPLTSIWAGNSVTANSPAGADAITLASVGAIAPGHLFRIDWEHDLPGFPAGLCARVKAMEGTTLWLDRPLPVDLAAGSTLVTLLHGVPVEDVAVVDGRAVNGAYGAVAGAFGLSGAANCELHVEHAEGFRGQALVTISSVDSVCSLKRAVRCGGATAAWEAFTCSGMTYEGFRIEDAPYFGQNVGRIAYSQFSDFTVQRRTNQDLGQPAGGVNFARALKYGQTCHCRMRDLTVLDWYGVGVWFENWCQNNDMTNVTIRGVRRGWVESPGWVQAIMQGHVTNGHNNSGNRFAHISARFNDTSGGGRDIGNSSGANGKRDLNNRYSMIDGDVISFLEPTTIY